MGSLVIPEPQDKQWFPKSEWLKRHEAYVQRARELQHARVVFLGDSITEGWAGAGRAAWDRDFAPLPALNLGISGDEVQHVHWRVRNGEIDGLDPAAVVLLIGTNNIGNVGHKAPDVAQGVEALLGAVRERLPRATVLLHAIFPRAAKPDAPHRLEVADTNRRLPALCDGQSVRFLDLTDRFVESDGTISPEVMPDALHLSPLAYGRWAEAIGPVLREIVG